MDLLDFIAAQQALRPTPTLRDRFEQFDKENPHVYALFVKYARQVKNSGFDRFSAKAIFERLRWHLNFETHDFQPFKLNNSYTAFYARKVIEEFPEFVNFFELRERKK